MTNFLTKRPQEINLSDAPVMFQLDRGWGAWNKKDFSLRSK
jgi:hypothetical protein